MATFVPDAAALEQLTGMGFSVNRATRGLMQSGNKSEAALEFLLAHADDASLDAPLPDAGGAAPMDTTEGGGGELTAIAKQ